MDWERSEKVGIGGHEAGRKPKAKHGLATRCAGWKSERERELGGDWGEAWHEVGH